MEKSKPKKDPSLLDIEEKRKTVNVFYSITDLPMDQVNIRVDAHKAVESSQKDQSIYNNS